NSIVIILLYLGNASCNASYTSSLVSRCCSPIDPHLTWSFSWHPMLLILLLYLLRYHESLLLVEYHDIVYRYHRASMPLICNILNNKVLLLPVYLPFFLLY